MNPNKITERLLKRDAERKEKLLKRKEEKEAEGSKHEQYEQFNSIFEKKTSEIEATLGLLHTLPKENLSSVFDKIYKDICDLQKSVADSCLFLRNYDMKICQDKLTKLTNNMREQENVLLPKEQFEFKSTNDELDEGQVASETDGSTQESHEKSEEIKIKIEKLANETNLRDVKNKSIHLSGEETSGKYVSLQKVAQSNIKITGAPITVHISDLADCTVLVGPVSTSVFAERCMNCKFVFACQQLRLHTSENCDIYLHITSRGIIEDCTNIRFAPFNWEYDTIQADFTDAKLSSEPNNWQCIDDFNWLMGTQSPNWSIIDENDRKDDWNEIIFETISENIC